jgi:hypothetical protein
VDQGYDSSKKILEIFYCHSLVVATSSRVTPHLLLTCGFYFPTSLYLLTLTFNKQSHMTRTWRNHIHHRVERVQVTPRISGNSMVQSNFYIWIEFPNRLLSYVWGTSENPRSTRPHTSNISLKSAICPSDLGVAEKCSNDHMHSLNLPAINHSRSCNFALVRGWSGWRGVGFMHWTSSCRTEIQAVLY